MFLTTVDVHRWVVVTKVRVEAKVQNSNGLFDCKAEKKRFICFLRWSRHLSQLHNERAVSVT